MHNKQKGVSLLELMIVVAIVAIISAFAYPSYMRYIVNTKRSAATSALLQIADRQQQFFMDNKRFTNDLTVLGFAANPLILKDDGNSTVAGDPDAVYSVSLSNVAATTYTITAAPLNGQGRDTECASLTLTQAGTRGSSAGGADCW
ncbi:MAG: prepilin-type N-terminal cleavage/methylation domain-containing protein [Gammaproteobacteria bacterium]|nr:prepilin-type N-terminal cleavage/methylation domain-containing protein [Gammaproteobacteria bacterium]MDH5304201.1 prepilin-type N-terminal cleavage/methylation domain-containing protein [Gammaproteobacteria bacterium]MDH5322895.1 prepilin-type N-terminal cleavage/methylation domain-containing protein [Gammaproteobacteria bacterium]